MSEQEWVQVSEALGAALQQEGDVLTNLGLKSARKIKVARDNEFLTSALVDSSEEILRFESEFQKVARDNPAGYTEAYAAQIDDIYQTHLSNAPSQESHDQLASTFASQRTNKFRSALQFEEQATIDNFVNTSEESLNLISNRLANDASTLPQSQLEIDQLVSNAREILGPKKANQFEDFAQKTLTRSVVTGLVNSGEFDSARDFLGTSGVEQLLSADEIGALEDSVNNDQKSAINREKEIADAEYKTLTDETKGAIIDGELTETDLNKMRSKEAFRTEDDYIKLRNFLRTERDTQSQSTTDISRVSRAINGTLPLNPGSSTDRKAMDTYYRDVIVPNTEPAELARVTQDLILTVGVIPDTMLSTFKAGITNGDANSRAGTSSLVRNLINQNTALSNSFDSSEIATLTKIDTLVKSGFTPEQAVEAHEQSVRLLPQTLTLRRQSLSDSPPSIDLDDFDDFFGFTPNRADSELVVSAWTNAANSLVLDFGLSVKEAEEVATNMTKGTFGTSDIGANEHFMRYPPEKMYGIPNVDDQWMTEELKTSLSPIVDIDKLEGMRIMHDPRTRKNQPEYFIMHTVRGLEAQVTDNQGRPVIWKPDFDAFKAGRIEAAKELRVEGTDEQITDSELEEEELFKTLRNF